MRLLLLKWISISRSPLYGWPENLFLSSVCLSNSEGKSKKEKGAPIQRSTETGMAVELNRNMSRQPSRESNNGSMNSYNSEGKSVNQKPHTSPSFFSTSSSHLLLSARHLHLLLFVNAAVLLLLFLSVRLIKDRVVRCSGYCSLKWAVMTAN